MSPWERRFAVALCVGLALRVGLIICSHGSNDMVTWAYFADTIRDHGLWFAYENLPLFNHPPLMGWMASALRQLAQFIGLEFRIVYKLPMLGADLVSLVLLAKIWTRQTWLPRATPRRVTILAALAIFSCNPISILVTAFHGNTDSLCAMFGLLAAYFHSRGRWSLAGLALAASVNVKIVGVMWAPALFFLCPKPKDAANLVAGFCAGMLPFALPMWFCPSAFIENVFQYNSSIDYWGIQVVTLKFYQQYPDIAVAALAYRSTGRYVILAVIIACALWSRFRGFSAFQAAAASMGIFLIMTPGFGVQYLVWVVPVLAGASLVRSALWGATGGAFIGWVYYSYLIDVFPWRSFHNRPMDEPIWVVGVIAWFVLLGSVLYLFKPWLNRAPQSA